MNLEEQFIQTNGIRLHVVEAGPKSGPPVILLHGFPEFWYGWRKQIPVLAEAGFRVIVPDQRGYNLSDKPKGVRAYKLNQLTSDILGLIDALEYEKVNLVGHDWGAVVAWTLGIRNAERLHRLSIMNVPHPAVMKRFLQRDIEQLRRSWYAILFQLPWIPESGMMANHWRGAERVSARKRKNPHVYKRRYCKIQGSLVAAQCDDFHDQLVPRCIPTSAAHAKRPARQNPNLDVVGNKRCGA